MSGLTGVTEVTGVDGPSLVLAQALLQGPEGCTRRGVVLSRFSFRVEWLIHRRHYFI